MVSTAEAIAIAEICVYVPALILTIFVVVRHGFQKQLGWIYLAIFSIIRLAGAIFEIKKVHNPTNKTDIEWSGILQSIGLSPLLMASLGLLKRLTDEVSNHMRSNQSQSLPLGGIGKVITSRATADSRRSRVIQILQLPAMIALVLCIVGGIDEGDTKPSDISTGRKYIKVGVLIFLAVYLFLAAIVIVTIKDIGNAPSGEKRIYLAIVTAIPLIGARILWSLLSAFSHNPSFSINSSKPLIQFFMATLEEFAVVVIYTITGLITRK